MVLAKLRDVGTLRQIQTNTGNIRRLDTRVTQNATRTTQLESRVQALRGVTEQRVQQLINKTVGPLNQRVSAAETRIGNNESSITGIRQSISAAEQRLLNRINADKTAENTAISRINASLTSLQNKDSRHDSDISSLTQNLNNTIARVNTAESNALSAARRVGNLETVTIPSINSTLTDLNAKAGGMRPSSLRAGFRASGNNLSSAGSALDSARTGAQANRSGAALNMRNARVAFSAASTNISTWRNNPIANIGSGVNAVVNMSLGVLELSNASDNIISWMTRMIQGFAATASNLSTSGVNLFNMKDGV